MMGSGAKKLIVGLILLSIMGLVISCKVNENKDEILLYQEKNQNQNKEYQDLKQDENHKEKVSVENNNNVLSQEDINLIQRCGYYSVEINSKEDYTYMLEKIHDNKGIIELRIFINCDLDSFLPKDFVSLASLKRISIFTLCSLANKMDYLPWFEQNDYDLEIVWNKDSIYYDSDIKPPMLSNLKEFQYYNQLNFQEDDYLEVYNKKIHGDRSYQVFTFINKNFDYYYNDLGRTTMLIDGMGIKTEVQCINVVTPSYVDLDYGEKNSHNIYFDDLNFDGYEDIYMSVMVSGGKGYQCYYAFIWDEKEKQYIEDESFTCFWYNYGSFLVDNEKKRIIYGKAMTASDSYFGIIEYQNGRFIETKSLDITGVVNDNNIPDYEGFVSVYNYSENGKLKKTLYKKAEEELSEEEIRDNFPELQFVTEFYTKW